MISSPTEIDEWQREMLTLQVRMKQYIRDTHSRIPDACPELLKEFVEVCKDSAQTRLDKALVVVAKWQALAESIDSEQQSEYRKLYSRTSKLIQAQTELEAKSRAKAEKSLAKKGQE
jgi:predicted  nucleic acid-binding Zn ribbon protein